MTCKLGRSPTLLTANEVSCCASKFDVIDFIERGDENYEHMMCSSSYFVTGSVRAVLCPYGTGYSAQYCRSWSRKDISAHPFTDAMVSQVVWATI